MYKDLNIGDILYINNSVAYISNITNKDNRLEINLKFLSLKDFVEFRKYIFATQRSSYEFNLTMQVSKKEINRLLSKNKFKINKVIKA